MLCTNLGTVVEYNIISFVAGVVLTTIFFVRFMIKHRKHKENNNAA